MACQAGTYSTVLGSSTQADCRNCETGMFWVNSSACEPCPEFTTSPAGAAAPRECMSLAGFYGAPGRRALMCPSNHFCPLGTSEPASCPSGMVSDAGASQCTPAPYDVVLLSWIFMGSWSALFLMTVSGYAAYKRGLWRKFGSVRGGEIRIRIFK